MPQSLFGQGPEYWHVKELSQTHRIFIYSIVLYLLKNELPFLMKEQKSPNNSSYPNGFKLFDKKIDNSNNINIIMNDTSKLKDTPSNLTVIKNEKNLQNKSNISKDSNENLFKMIKSYISNS